MSKGGTSLPGQLTGHVGTAFAEAPARPAPERDGARPTEAGPPRRPLLCLGLGLAGHDALLHGLRTAGWQVAEASDLAAAAALLDGSDFHVGLLALKAGDAAAWRQAAAFLAAHTRLLWVALLEPAPAAPPPGLDAVLRRVFEHHRLPVDLARLLASLGHASDHAGLRQRLPQPAVEPGDAEIIGHSAATRRLQAHIARVADVDAPVLIQGESGTGKALAARAIHRASSRSSGPFVAVTCASMQVALAPLGRHGHGAFPAGDADRGGCMEAANGGTLFLDEVGDLSPDMQVSLQQFLQDGVVHRPGAAPGRPVDVRVIAATQLDLEQCSREGRFRNDLYYRLSVLPLQVPPLRERQQDIAELAQHFYALYAHERRAGLKGFSPAALDSMQLHAWPGNVRELHNRVRRALVMAEGPLILPQDMGLAQASPQGLRGDALDLARTSAERNAICMSLQRAGHNVTQAAKALGVSRMTLYRLMAKHGIRS